MKKATFIFIALFALTIFTHTAYAADRTEKVRVIRVDKGQNDMIVQKANGERLLIQHNQSCSSMTTEFPVYLLWSGGKITHVKVAINERCKVNNFGPYGGNAKVTKRIKSPSPFVTEHLAEIEWKNSIYEIDYGEGCKNLREFVNENVYLDTASSKLKGATLYFPRYRGQCTIKSVRLLEALDVLDEIESPIKNIQYKAENNEVYFYWDEYKGDEKWFYLIAHSRYELNPDDYHYRQMPNLRYSIRNEYTERFLSNDRAYYFYLSARDRDGNIAPWQEIKITPIKTNRNFKNNLDPEEFEVRLDDSSEDNFVLTWPDKSENSRRWLIQLFVDGKRRVFKMIDGTINEYTISKQKYSAEKMRFIIRSVAKERFGATYSDGIFWKIPE